MRRIREGRVRRRRRIREGRRNEEEDMGGEKKENKDGGMRRRIREGRFRRFSRPTFLATIFGGFATWWSQNRQNFLPFFLAK